MLTLVDKEHFQQAINNHATWAEEMNRGVARSEDPKRLQVQQLHIRNVRYEGLNLHSLDFRACFLEDVEFVDCSMSGSLFLGTIFEGCGFVRCDLKKSDFIRVTCIGSDFSMSSLVKSQLTHSIMPLSNFDRTDLSGALIWGCDLRFSSFNHVTLHRTFLKECNLFTNAQFPVDHFENVIIEDCTLDFAMKGEKFSGVKVSDYLFEMPSDADHLSLFIK